MTRNYAFALWGGLTFVFLASVVAGWSPHPGWLLGASAALIAAAQCELDRLRKLRHDRVEGPPLEMVAFGASVWIASALKFLIAYAVLR